MIDYGLVSIITPSWNSSKYALETIKSIQAQTYPNWELLFQDDCSTDDTKEVVSKLASCDTRIKYECNKTNSGAALTRNRAISRAKGKWIAFLDSDDLWYPDKLENQIKFMVKNGYHFTYTNYCEIDSNSDETGIIVTGPKHITKRLMYLYDWIGCLTVIYNREYVGMVQIGDLKKNNDYALWLKIIKKADCYLYDKILAKYRRGRSGSIRSNQKAVVLIKHLYIMFRTEEGFSNLSAFIHTCLCLICVCFKKLVYTKKYII